MVSLNKVIISPREIANMYVSEKMSIPEISEKTVTVKLPNRCGDLSDI